LEKGPSVLQEMHCFRGKGPVICQNFLINLQMLLMLGWLWKDILWACQALLISTRSTPPLENEAKKVCYTREAFFGAKRSGFGEKRLLQKSKNHLFAQ
jgi:hypothetical protein